MSIGCRIHLPCDVTSRWIAPVIGVLAGCRAERYTIAGAKPDTVFARVPLATASGHVEIPGMDVITIREAATGQAKLIVTVHYGSRHDGKPCVTLLPSSTALWCAIAKRLVDWFGGTVFWQEEGTSYTSPRTCPTDPDGLLPEKDEPWDAYHRALLALAPVSERDVEAARDVAAYR